MNNTNSIGEFVNTLTPKEKALFYKLWELVKRGVDGEQENAKRLIEIFCEKRGSKWELLENTDDVSDHYISGVNNIEILTHVIAKVTDSWEIRFRKSAKRGKYIVKCTPAQAVEIEVLTDIYQKAYQRELKKLRLAFLYAHNLFPASTRKEQKCIEEPDDDIVEMSEKEIREYRKRKQKELEHQQFIREASFMAGSISSVRTNKRIGSGEDD